MSLQYSSMIQKYLLFATQYLLVCVWQQCLLLYLNKVQAAAAVRAAVRIRNSSVEHTHTAEDTPAERGHEAETLWKHSEQTLCGYKMLDHAGIGLSVWDTLLQTQ